MRRARCRPVLLGPCRREDGCPRLAMSRGAWGRPAAPLQCGPSPWARLRLTRGDEPAQVAVHQHAPGVRAILEALEGRHEPSVCETKLGPRALLGDLEDDVRVLPLFLFSDEGELSFEDVPDDLLARHGFGDLLLG